MAKTTGMPAISGSVGMLTFTKNGYVRERVLHRKPSVTRKAVRQHCVMRGMMAACKMFNEQLMQTYEDCPNGGVASNLFLKYNRDRTQAWIPKRLYLRGASFVLDYVVSHGSLYSIVHHLDEQHHLCSDIVLASDITPATTVGQLSADILAGNPHFERGDELKLFCLEQRQALEPPIPQVACCVRMLRLDIFDTTLLSEVTGSRSWCRREGCLALAEPLSEAGAAFVHVRVGADGKVQASTQSLLCVNPVAEPYTTEEAFETAYKSFTRGRRV